VLPFLGREGKIDRQLRGGCSGVFMEIGGLPLEDGEGLVLFEVDEADELGPQPVSDEAKAVTSFAEALERVRPAVGRVLATLQ